MTELTDFNLHEDASLFREAVNFTASRTGFSQRLIEKDYFCTVLLAYLSQSSDDSLVFKGGTCLAKIHAGFYRLSEDLDFMISTPINTPRSQRSQHVVSIKRAMADIANHVAVFAITQPFAGANNSTQYNGAVTYQSPITSQRESILIEVSAREPLLIPAEQGQVKTILLDPIGGDAMLPTFAVNGIALLEAVAEKFRAALSRRDVAIRDFYDLHYIAEHLEMDMNDPHLIELVRRKLAVPGNQPVDMGPERTDDLKQQLGPRLGTVLRKEDFRAFDLNHAIHLVTAMAEQV